MSAPSIAGFANASSYDSIWAALTITSQGSSAVTECGAVYALTATNADPTMGGTGVTKVPAAGTTGLQDAYMLGLTPGAEYTFKIFATNGSGTTYGSPVTYTLPPSPGTASMEDVLISIVDDDQVTFAGHVYSENGCDVTHRGFVYALTSLNPAPEIDAPGVTDLPDGSDYGRFDETLTLAPGSYSVRAYAINFWGTAYTSAVDFTVSPPPVVTTMKVISDRPGPWSAASAPLVLAKPVIETTPSGWDSMRERLLVPFSPYFSPGERRDHMLDSRAQPFAHMLMQEERVVGFKGGFPEVEVLSLGFAREKPWTIQTTADSQGEVGSVSGVIRNLPTFTLVWFSETLEDTKTVIPSAAVPPETFGWPASAVTTGSGNNFGFVLIKRDIDPLPVITGSTPQAQPASSGATRANANLNPRPTLCRVTDYYVYDMTNALPPNQ